MLVHLNFQSPDDILEAVKGFDTVSAFCRVNSIVRGTAKIKFIDHEILDRGLVFSDATELLIFLDSLITGSDARLTLRFEARAYTVRKGNGFDVFNFDDKQFLDHISLRDIRIMLDYVENFLRNALMEVNPTLCSYYLTRQFML